jgi:cystathionine beta-lyase
LLSFETGSLEASRIIVEETALYKITVSFGNVVSLISLPCYMSHASIPAEVRAARGLPDDLVRISVGIEDVEDLISDLDQAMARAMAAIGFDPAHPTPGIGKGAVNSGTVIASSASGNGAGVGVSGGGAAQLPREAALVARIEALEAQLAAAGIANGSSSGHSMAGHRSS